MIDRFIEALNREAEMSAVEIADILWLAVQLQESESDSSDSSDSFDSSDSSDSSVSSPVEEEKDSDNDTEELKQEQEIAPEEKSQTSDSNKITTDQPSKEKKARIYPRHQGQTSKTDLYFKTPNAPSLRSPLTIAQQAFNPLIRRVPGSTSPILDEVATSQGIADTGLWLPVLRPTLEPWLDLELVVDESISMQIWRQTIIDLKKLLTNYGIFRDVRVWGLIINDGEPVQIRRGIGAMAKNRYPRSPKELIDDSGRRLVLVASDCVSPPWRDGKVTEVLQLWAHRLPMAIIQMLPKWLWKRTALGIGTEVRLRGLTPGISNQNLIAEGVSLLSELDEKNGVKVPVFTLEADKAGSWAQMLSGQGSIWTSGVMFELDKTLVNQEDRLFNLDYSKLTAQQRVQTFRVTASPMARKLAGLLAAAPVITLPVVRLIREVLLKDSLQVNMAEVFLGGLLKPVSEVNLETHPDQVLYDFMDGVRELLVDSVPLSYVKDVVDEVSEYVAKKAGLSLESFAAVLRNPQKVWEGEFTDEVRYFATVSPGVLRRLGGEFVQVAKKLEGNLGSTIPDGEITTEFEEKRHFLLQEGKSKIYSICTDQPWSLPFDALVIPSEPRVLILGGFGRALANFLEEDFILLQQAIKEGMKETNKNMITPNEPLLVTLPSKINTKLFFSENNKNDRFIICATTESPRSSVANVFKATESIIFMIGQKNISRLVLPLFATGNLGLPASEVAPAMLSGITQSLKKISFSSIEEITIVSTRESIIATLNQVALNHIALEEKQGKLFTFEVVTVDNSGSIINRTQESARQKIKNLGNGIKLEMVYIPGGSFLMGSPENEAGRYSSESPQNIVTLRPFFMSKYPITQNQYQAIMGNNPSYFKGGNRPVETVHWGDAIQFCRQLSKRTGKGYMLPSESQWEYACRAGTTTPFYFGETITSELVNYDGNYPYAEAPKGIYREETTDVGIFPPNSFGLYDMHGNVWEWCADTDGSIWFDRSKNSSPLRGGCWYIDSDICRSACRGYLFNRRDYPKNYIGFRVVCSVEGNL